TFSRDWSSDVCSSDLAVRGSISALDIKRSLNEFANFNITLEQSGTLFDFLAIRAAQTGKSITQLRDSLVEGLSKESLLRIDNLRSEGSRGSRCGRDGY